MSNVFELGKDSLLWWWWCCWLSGVVVVVVGSRGGIVNSRAGNVNQVYNDITDLDVEDFVTTFEHWSTNPLGVFKTLIGRSSISVMQHNQEKMFKRTERNKWIAAEALYKDPAGVFHVSTKYLASWCFFQSDHPNDLTCQPYINDIYLYYNIATSRDATQTPPMTTTTTKNGSHRRQRTQFAQFAFVRGTLNGYVV